MILLISVVKCILLVYFVCALVLFFSFIINKAQVKYTNYKTGEVSYLEGYKKLLAYLGIAIIWIFVIKFNEGE